MQIEQLLACADKHLFFNAFTLAEATRGHPLSTLGKPSVFRIVTD